MLATLPLTKIGAVGVEFSALCADGLFPFVESALRLHPAAARRTDELINIALPTPTASVFIISIGLGCTEFTCWQGLARPPSVSIPAGLVLTGRITGY
jgi:hypothetical protein